MSDLHVIADIPVKAIIWKDDKFILVQEEDGRWALPGGRMSVGETPREALKRELMEELNLEIEAGELIDCNLYTGKSGMNHFMVIFDSTASDHKAEPSLDNKEVFDFKWVDLDEALDMNIRNEYKTVFNKLKKLS